MASLSDHDRRDAEHAARAYVGIILGKFRRRMEEKAKALIQDAFSSKEAESIRDWTAFGTEAGEKSVAVWIDDSPQESIEHQAIEGDTAEQAEDS